MKKLLIAVVSGTLLFCSSVFAKNQEIAATVIQAKNPEVKAISIGANETQVFVDLKNNGVKEHTLIAAVSPLAKETQLHKTIEVNGQPEMRQVNHIDIQAHQERDLQQGGFHVMLIGLSNPLKIGQKIPITLVFADGSDVVIHATVERV